MTPPAQPKPPLLELRRYSRALRSHRHDFHQLVLPVEGALVMTVDTVQDEVAQNRAAIIAAGRDHAFSGSDGNCFVVADIPESLISGWGSLPPYLALDPLLAQYVRFMHQALSRPGDHGNRQMLMLLLQLMQQAIGDGRPPDRRVEAGCHYIEQNFNRDLALDEVARAANLSPRQLSHLFRRQFGMSPMRYQLDLRMQQAQHLLTTTDWPVQCIAHRLGYQNASAFSNRFKRHFGQTPGYFRRNGT
jgi:AraC-like DNA-binding protein